MKRPFYLCLWLITFSAIFFDVIPSEIGPSEPNFTVYYQQEQDTAPEVAILYAHGLGATQWQGKRLFAKIYALDEKGAPLANKCWLYDQPMALFDFPDAKNNKKMGYHRQFVNLAGPQDIDRMFVAHHKAKKALPGVKFIGSGLSRGASSWLVYMAQEQPDDVVALILEAGFDTLDSVVHHMLKRFNASWLPYGTSLGRYVMSITFPAVNFLAPTPLDLVEKIPVDLPILIVHSQSDNVVPVQCSRTLYTKLYLTGHRNIHYLELQNGTHGKAIWGADQELYQNTVHAFLKKYNLPYCTEFADNGQEAFATTQSMQEDLLQRW